MRTEEAFKVHVYGKASTKNDKLAPLPQVDHISYYECSNDYIHLERYNMWIKKKQTAQLITSNIL